jgi:phage-related protein
VRGEDEKPKLASIAWEGDSREVLKAFPEAVTENFGLELWQLQQGEQPRNYRPLPSIGPGVFELRDQDERVSRIEHVIYVLHCFEKKSREMSKKDFEKAKQRFEALKSRLAEEKKREKRI